MTTRPLATLTASQVENFHAKGAAEARQDRDGPGSFALLTAAEARGRVAGWEARRGTMPDFDVDVQVARWQGYAAEVEAWAATVPGRRDFEVVVYDGETPEQAAANFANEAGAAVTVASIDTASGSGHPVTTFVGPAGELDKLTAHYDNADILAG